MTLYAVRNQKGQYMFESRDGDTCWVSDGRAWVTSSKSEAKDTVESLTGVGAGAEVVSLEVLGNGLRNQKYWR